MWKPIRINMQTKKIISNIINSSNKMKGANKEMSYLFCFFIYSAFFISAGFAQVLWFWIDYGTISRSFCVFSDAVTHGTKFAKSSPHKINFIKRITASWPSKGVKQVWDISSFLHVACHCQTRLASCLKLQKTSFSPFFIITWLSISHTKMENTPIYSCSHIENRFYIAFVILLLN